MRVTVKMAAIMAIVTVFVAGNALAGYHFTSETRAENEGQQPFTYTVEGWVEGDGAKIVFKDGPRPAGIPEGSYVVSSDGGKTLFLVNPKEKTYSRFDLQAMMGAAGSLMHGMSGVMKMKIEDKKVDAKPPVDGGKILGLPTKKYVFDTSYTLAMSVLGMKHRMHTVTHEEIWATTALTDPGFGAWLSKKPEKTGYPELDELIAMAMHDIEGITLKQVMETTTTDKKGKSQHSTQTTRVTSLEKASVDPAMFTVPSGFTEKPLAPAGAPEDQGAGPEGGEEAPHGLGGLLKAIGG